VREGIEAPLFDGPADIPTAVEAGDTRMATARHRVDYARGTRLASGAEIDLERVDGSNRTIKLEPILKFQMKGLGYMHPEWRQGAWQGELATGHESFDPRQLDPLAPENLHVQQVVRASDGSKQGIGVLEQICIGSYEPSGFESFLDGSR